MKNPEPGNFAGVVMEMINKLKRKEMHLAPCETNVLFFFLGELNGNLFKRRLIKTIKIREGTGLERNVVDNAVKALINKGILVREKTEAFGNYWYQFNEQTFGRVYGVKEIREDTKGVKLIEKVQAKKLSTKTKTPTKECPVQLYTPTPNCPVQLYTSAQQDWTLPRTKFTEFPQRHVRVFFPEVKELSAQESGIGDFGEDPKANMDKIFKQIGISRKEVL